MLHDANDVESPALRLRRPIAQRLEGDTNFNLVSIFGHTSLRLKDKVLTDIGVLARRALRQEAPRLLLIRLEDRSVHLDAEGIYAEDQGLTAVIESAEEKLHLIIGIDAIAIGERRDRRAVTLERPDAEVNRRRRIQTRTCVVSSAAIPS